MSLPPPASSLHELSDQELALYQRVASLVGTIEDKHEQLVASSIGDSYLQVHRAYLQLAAESPSAATRLEALKRLVFLNWYLMTEPDIYSGLSYYDPDLMRASFTLLEAYLATTSPLDPELHWMLSHYAAFWDDDLLSAITGRPLPVLSAFIAAKDPRVYLAPQGQLPPGAMASRGQMGLYWQSLGVESRHGPAPRQ
ncbi:MAG: hypothetical protein EOO62_04740 [Hymenobacter sp.]|nr:MAG: hypothetical protein EOO62_04740 [Hymenobacter sp.]